MLYAVWYGGGSYNTVESRDVETFPNLAEVREQFGSRYAGWGHHVYADGRTETCDTPAVDDTCEMHVWPFDPRDVYAERGEWPDAVWTVTRGPNGGRRVRKG